MEWTLRIQMNQSEVSSGTHHGFETSRKFYCKFAVKIRENEGFDQMGYDPLPDERALV
jgi:hypothetical protein